MDAMTLATYDREALTFAEDWLAQPAPTDLYALLERYFVKGKTADIGCGAGRDTAWLASRGFDVIGFDGSEGLLKEASRRYPALVFKTSLLPELAGVERQIFQNVLCETVIMHLPDAEIREAVIQLLSLLVPGGVLALSWRISDEKTQRDDHGRLYSMFSTSNVLDELQEHELLVDSESINLSSQKKVRRIVVKKRR